MPEPFRYAAFISYSSRDAKFAGRLHRAFEKYRIPKTLGEFSLTNGGKQNRIYPVFRDREELSTGHLADLIEAGLASSACLVVVCSPNAAASPWVQKEIEHFVALGRRDRIFAIIAPNSPLTDVGGDDATLASFPPAFKGDALSGDPLEPLAADARKGKDGFRNAMLKVVAGMIRVNAGALRDRDVQQQNARRVAWSAGFAAASSFVIAALAVVSILVVSANQIRVVSLAERARAVDISELHPGVKSFPDAAARYARAALNPRIPWPFALDTKLAETELARAGAFGSLEAILKAPPGWIYDVDYAPDGQTVAMVGETDGHAIAGLWDAKTGNLRFELKGHTKRVNTVAYAPDSKSVFTGGWDGSARLWDVATGEERFALPADESGRIENISYSSDSALVATGGMDGAVRVWDAHTGVKRLEARTGEWIFALAFSPDANLIAAGSGTLVGVWDVKTGVQRAQFSMGLGKVSSLDFSPNSQRLVSADSDGAAKVWDVGLKQEIAVLQGHQEGITSARFSPDGKKIATASYDRTARLWDAETGMPIEQFRGHTHQLLEAVFSPDGSRVATAQRNTASDDSAVRIWSAAPKWYAGEAALLAVLSSSSVQPVGKIAFSPDGRHILAAGNENQGAGIWKSAPGPDYTALGDHTGPVQLVNYTPDGTAFVTAGDDGLAVLRDGVSGKALAVLNGGGDAITALDITPTQIATAHADGGVRLWNAKNGRLMYTLTSGSRPLLSVAFSDDGRWVGGAGVVGDVTTWDAQTGHRLSAWQAHEGAVRKIAFSPANRTVASVGDDGALRLWDSKTGTKLAEFKRHEGQVWALAFSADGGRVATVGQDNYFRLWDVNGRRLINEQKAHIAPPRYVVLSPKGDLFATGGMDGEARLWDSATGAQRGQLRGHVGEVRSLAFSPDQQIFATGSFDGTVRLWAVTTADLLGVLNGHVGAVRATFSPAGAELVTVSKDGATRIWDMRYFTKWRGRELKDRVCAVTLANGLSKFSPNEMLREPSLDPHLDADPCAPPPAMARISAAFRQFFSK